MRYCSPLTVLFARETAASAPLTAPSKTVNPVFTTACALLEKRRIEKKEKLLRPPQLLLVQAQELPIPHHIQSNKSQLLRNTMGNTNDTLSHSGDN